MASMIDVLKENTVGYKIFLPTVDDLHDIRTKIMEMIAPFTAQYIWHKEPFNIDVVNHCLIGSVDFGDNIEDEWFIVFILFQISNRFEETVMEVVDDDGQFLLIEAADMLPKWMCPDSCLNRVFIHRGNIHVISPKHMEKVDSHLEAVNFVLKNSDKTIAPDAINKCILKRIEGYPDSIPSYQYSFNCFIPANLALILSKHPQMISLGVNAFCESQATKTKLPKSMNFFKPVNRILHRVTMTKCQFAQLSYHRFNPNINDRWKTADLISTLGAKSLDMGAKLSYGFEIVCKKAEITPGVSNAAITEEKLLSSPHFDSFLKSLKEKNYFHDNIEGSREYQRLLQQAKTYYMENFSSSSGNVNSYILQCYSTLLELAQQKIDVENMKKENTNLPPDDGESLWWD